MATKKLSNEVQAPFSSNQDPPLAYLEEAPPPAAFGQVPSPTVQLSEKRNYATGEVYEETCKPSKADNRAAGESVEQIQPKTIIVVSAHAGNQYPGQARGAEYQNFQYASNAPDDLLACKLKDQRVNACGSGDSCVCFCHLQLASYGLSALFIIGNMFAIERYVVSGWWCDYGLKEYDLVLGIYFTVHVFTNISCVVGVAQCHSLWIRPQPFVLMSYILVIITNTVLNMMIHETYLPLVLMMLVEICFYIWCAWIFYRVYRWAYYFENGGSYIADMFEPPTKSELKQQQPVALAQNLEMHALAVPQDGI